MDSKKKMYIIIIAVAAAVLIGLIIWAICLHVNRPADSTEPSDGQKETTSQSTENTTEEAQTDTTGEATTQPEDTTGEITDPTETTGIDETKPDVTGNSNSDSGNDNKTDNTSGEEPDNDPDNNSEEEPDSGNASNSTPTTPASTESPLPDVYPYTLTYKEYLNMTEDEQIAFYKLFANHSEFKKWRTAAKKEYDENKIELEIGEDGKIDLSPITGKN